MPMLPMTTLMRFLVAALLMGEAVLAQVLVISPEALRGSLLIVLSVAPLALLPLPLLVGAMLEEFTLVITTLAPPVAPWVGKVMLLEALLLTHLTLAFQLEEVMVLLLTLILLVATQLDVVLTHAIC